MSDSIEMDVLPIPRSSGGDDDDDNDDNNNDGTISIWAWTSAFVFASFAICLLVFPRLLLLLAEPSGGRITLTSLEKYLALQLGIVLCSLSITIVAVMPNEWPTGPQRRVDPNSHPLLRPVTAASLVMALLSFDNRSVSTLATTTLFGSSVLGLFGLWVLVFSGPRAISRKTGADKHTSSFIFGNKNAASVQKRLWKRRHQSK